MLAIVSWSSASRSPLLVACLLVGAASILGMFCRGLTYEIEKRPGDKWQIPLSWSWRPTNSPRMFDGANGVASKAGNLTLGAVSPKVPHRSLAICPRDLRCATL